MSQYGNGTTNLIFPFLGIPQVPSKKITHLTWFCNISVRESETNPLKSMTLFLQLISLYYHTFAFHYYNNVYIFFIRNGENWLKKH